MQVIAVLAAEIVFVVVVFAIGRLLIPRLLAWRGVKLVRKTMFGPALIFDAEDADGTPVRLLNVNGTFQSVCYIDKELRFELSCVCQRIMAEVIRLAGGPGNAIILGGGGYSLPKYLVAKWPRAHIAVVEIDPVMTQIAREDFFLDDLIETYDAIATDRLELICADGWDCLRKAAVAPGKGPYELVINDAFSGKHPLGPMATDEGAHIIHECLSGQGLYLANLIGTCEGRGSRYTQQTLKVFSQEFDYVYFIPERPQEPRRRSSNTMVAADYPLPITEIFEGAYEVAAQE